MQVLALILALSDVLLAVAVFLWILRPEVGLFWVARLAGCLDELRSDELSEAELDRLRWLTRLARLPLVVLVFLWSFAVGAMLAWARAPTG